MQEPPLRRVQELAAQGQFAEAESALRQRLKSFPDEIQALDLLGFVLFFQSRYLEAEDVCRRTIALSPRDAYAIKGLASCLAKQGRVREAIPHFQQAADLHPTWFDAYWDWAVALLEAGDIEEARAVATRGERAVPKQSLDWKRFLDHLRGRGKLPSPEADGGEGPASGGP